MIEREKDSGAGLPAISGEAPTFISHKEGVVGTLPTISPRIALRI